MGQIDLETRQFTTNDGATFTLLPLSPMVIERLKNDQWDRPQPPVVEVQIGKNGAKRKETNALDPDYIEALALWKQAIDKRLMTYLFTAGVEENPPEDEIEAWREFLPGVTPTEAKYLWVTKHLITVEEIQQFTEAIMGQTVPTQEGLEAAAATFPG